MRGTVWYFLAAAVLAISSLAQNADHDMGTSGQGQSGQAMQGMDTPGMNMDQAALSSIPSFHSSSGTAWQPASVPETMWMISPAAWELMLHGVVFVTDNQQGGPRG